ncbi:hypothetical protein CEXT_267571 [Caerostris extrusa]|uniref:Uncharacterized protein n=1 Tax=Caerostris extrusa TaxID=172846 RepID=A0AAV4Q9Z5_CAEEX|nr:hypothetical protein CEXT_267571 [Caerostris extrusa]
MQSAKQALMCRDHGGPGWQMPESPRENLRRGSDRADRAIAFDFLVGLGHLHRDQMHALHQVPTPSHSSGV